MGPYRCTNCGLDWADTESADECCAGCSRLMAMTGAKVEVCSQPRVWSAEPGDSRFPLGYCAEHIPADAKATT
ncbi:MAG: hypothetical protein ACRDXE_11285 [Acidimicrobiales bacterium]